jgi:superfamily II DNA or RNA helicase
MLTNTGYVTEKNIEIKKKLTVRPVENAMGIRPPSFKVFRETAQGLVVPRYFGCSELGPPTADKRSRPASADIKFTGVLREATRQPEAVERGKASFETDGGGVLSLPCGFGKTTCALALAAHLRVRTMIVVHKEFLANQWAEKIAEFCPGATIGRVQGDKLELENDFVIAMIQTMCIREHEPGAFDSIGLVIVDEAHHIGAPAFSQFMFKLCPKYTLGLTATPERKDGLTRLLYWFMGANFFTVERENQAQVKVVPLQFDCPEYRSAPPCTRFGKVSLAEVVNQLVELPDRNQLILDTIEKLKKEKRKILILSDRRGHCAWLKESIEGSALYIGGMKEEELTESAKAQVIVATFTLAHEGLDIPALDTVILSTPHSDVKQAVGRIMRETKGKNNDPVIYDMVDHWSVLWAMYSKRLKMYHDSGFAVDGRPAPKKEARPDRCLL